MLFNELGLMAELLRAVQDKNYTTPTQIQQDAIPAVLEGRDILAGSQTGTGKTASFTLPVLQLLMGACKPNKKNYRPIRALVMTPTRELASQVSESILEYGKHLPLKSNVVFGGVKISSQIFKLKRGTDILVATPGRLLDLVNQRVVDLSKVEILVLDEADRMLDMGFMPDIQRIISLLPAKTQNLMFSATYSKHIKKLANDLLSNPKVIDIGQGNSVATKINHIIHPVNPEQKRQALAYIVGSNNWKQVLVFTKTKRGAERLAKQLAKDGLKATAIHGDKTQAQRGKALADFKQGRARVLVATDVAARGLDINDLSHVVNFDLPMVAEDYIHRIGRTGRAGKHGEAISLVCPEEKHLLQDIEKLLKQSLQKVVIDDFYPDFDLNVFNKVAKPQNKKPARRRKPSNNAKPRRKKKSA